MKPLALSEMAWLYKLRRFHELKSHLLRFIKAPLHGGEYSRYAEYRAVSNGIAFAPPARLLDVGAGKSIFPWLLAKRGFSITTIDKDPNELQRGRDLASSVGMCDFLRDGCLQYQLADATNLPFEDASYEAAYAVSALDHLEGKGDTQAVHEMARVVKPNGRVIISVPFGKFPEESPQTWRIHYFERTYDYASLHTRIIRPSSLDLLNITYLGEWFGTDAPFFRWSQTTHPILRSAISCFAPLTAASFFRTLSVDAEHKAVVAVITLKKSATPSTTSN